MPNRLGEIAIDTVRAMARSKHIFADSFLPKGLGNSKNMWNDNAYELIDFGAGRKLERFGERRIIRTSPAAIGSRPDPNVVWHASWEYQSDGQWTLPTAEFGECRLSYRSMTFHLRPSASGNLGIFPEQAKHWDWLESIVSKRKERSSLPPKCLNLFAYTGGSSMAIALAGGTVTHVDSSRPAVKWAKENAASSSIDSGSIRWIEEDARSFVQRELRRGNRYDLIVLDPPTYGHGNKGDRWEIEVDLPRLLSDCVILLTEEPLGVLFTGHSPNIEPEAALDRALRSRRNLSRSGTQLDCGRSELASTTGKSLDCGYFARWWSVD